MLELLELGLLLEPELLPELEPELLPELELELPEPELLGLDELLLLLCVRFASACALCAAASSARRMESPRDLIVLR